MRMSARITGECPSTIISWINNEAKGVKRKGTTCTCLNTDGLYFTKSKPRPPPCELPPEPASLFSFLEELDTQKVCVHGRIARHVPHTTGKSAMYLAQKGGHFVCRHAHTMAVLRKMRKARAETNGRLFKFRGGMCNCELADLPQRNGPKSMAKLGDIPGKYGELR
jgi:hypothetical protein